MLASSVCVAGSRIPRTKTTYKKRLVSRQRYWGAPIPVFHVDGRAPIAVAIDDCLRWFLPGGGFKPNGREYFCFGSRLLIGCEFGWMLKLEKLVCRLQKART